jgi:hypothetical protein
MTIEITKEIIDAYGSYLNEVVDCDLNGRSILRRNTYPFDVVGVMVAMVDFAAGFQAGRKTTPPLPTINPELIPSKEKA